MRSSRPRAPNLLARLAAGAALFAAATSLALSPAGCSAKMRACEAGESRSCTCCSGTDCQGSQACASDGSDWQPCVCGAPVGEPGEAGPPGFPSKLTACDGPGQCTFAIVGCCGTCHENGLDILQAIRSGEEGAYADSTCPPPPPGGTGQPCSCGRAPLASPYLLAACVSGTCTGIDLRGGLWTSCSADSDCEICQRGGPPPAGLYALAVSQAAAYDVASCGSAGCGGCAQPPPGSQPYAHAACNPGTRQCEITYSVPDAGAGG